MVIATPAFFTRQARQGFLNCFFLRFGAHPTSASAYMWESLENQGINVIFAIAILLFLWYISKEPIGLLREMIKKKKKQIDYLKYKNSDYTDNKKPKY